MKTRYYFDHEDMEYESPYASDPEIVETLKNGDVFAGWLINDNVSGNPREAYDNVGEIVVDRSIFPAFLRSLFGARIVNNLDDEACRLWKEGHVIVYFAIDQELHIVPETSLWDGFIHASKPETDPDGVLTRHMLVGELEELNRYQVGDVWGVCHCIYDGPNPTEKDSRWGYYGLDHAREALEDRLDEARERAEICPCCTGKGYIEAFVTEIGNPRCSNEEAAHIAGEKIERKCPRCQGTGLA